MRLPPLRPGLALTPGETTTVGEPTVVLHDPLRHRFFRLGWQDLEILHRWHLGPAPAVVAALAHETPLAVSAHDVAGLTTVLVNLNPFMRFDGYFLLADLLGVPNLQPRAMAFLRGQAGRVLFGLPVPPDAAPLWNAS